MCDVTAAGYETARVPERIHDDEIEVDEAVVRHLLTTQFPDIADRQLTMIEPWGTDNAIWRLGADFVVRFLPGMHDPVRRARSG